MDVPPWHLSIPGGVQGQGIPIPGHWQHTWGPPRCGTAAAPGRLQPCWRLAWINKQIHGFVGFSTEQRRWGMHGEEAGGRRELPGAAVLPITARERGYRLRRKHRRAGARHPFQSCPPCRCFQLPSQTLPTLPGAAGMLLPYGKAYPGASRGAGDAACWECFESLLLAHTPGMLSGSCGSSSASLGSDIHLGPLLLGSQCKNQGGSTMGSPEVPTGLPRGFLHPMPFPSLLPGFSQLPGGGRLYPV